MLADPDDDPDIQLSIPIKPVFEELCCPICFNAINDCYMTPCGHNFCSKCIFECINRKHACPCCNHATVKESLVKNHHFDRLLTLVTLHKEESSKKYFESIINAKVQPQDNNTNNNNGNNNNANNQLRQLSPIETLFHKHMKRSLVSFEEYYKELQAQHNENVARLQAEYAKKMAIAPQSQYEALAAECAAKTGESEKGFEKATELLMVAYDTYLKDVAPAPAALPVSVTLSVPSRKMRFDGVVLKPTDLVRDARQKLEEKMTASGAKLVAWSPANVMVLKRGTEEVILNEDWAISQYRPRPGSELAIMGEIQLMSDRPPECFTLAFNPALPNQTCDYYTCKDCKFNWICKNCADNCHRGHAVSVYILGHKATWACCYCPKNNKCTIQNNKNTKKP